MRLDSIDAKLEVLTGRLAVEKRTANAERQARFRERQRNAASNAKVTLARAKRNAARNADVTVANGFELPEWVPAMQWNAWVESRAKLKKAPTPFAKRMALTKLEKLKTEGNAPAAVLAQSAFNGWSDLFPIKDKR